MNRIPANPGGFLLSNEVDTAHPLWRQKQHRADELVLAPCVVLLLLWYVVAKRVLF